MQDLNDMLHDAANELRSEGLIALATAVDVAREEREGVPDPPSSARLQALNNDQLTLVGMED